MTEKQWNNLIDFCGGQTVANMLEKDCRSWPKAGTFGEMGAGQVAIPIAHFGVVYTDRSEAPQKLLQEQDAKFAKGAQSLADAFFELDARGALVELERIEDNPDDVAVLKGEGGLTYINRKALNKIMKNGVTAWRGEKPDGVVYFTHKYGELFAAMAPIRYNSEASLSGCRKMTTHRRPADGKSEAAA